MPCQQCQQCGRKFKYPHQLRKHRKVHSMMNRTTYKCKICNKAFAFLSNLRQHLAQHFNYKSGENLYIDDLAIGVTIEPVDEPNCGWSSTPRGGKSALGPTRESPEGEPCHCVPSDNYAMNCYGPMYACGECPRHYSSRSQCLPYGHCIGHQANTACCCIFSPQTELPQARCSSTHHVNPQLVLHVDTTHDSMLALPAPEKNCTSQEKGTSEVPTFDDVGQQYKQVCSRRCVPIRSATVTRYEDGYDGDNDPADDVSDSDNEVLLEPRDKIPIISSQKRSNVCGPRAKTALCSPSSMHSSNNNSSLTLSKTSSSKTPEKCPTFSREDAGRSENEKVEQLFDKEREVPETRKSYGQYGCRNSNQKEHGKLDVGEIDDFDDVATFNDLSTFFPDFSDNHTETNSGTGVNSVSVIDPELNSDELLLGIVGKEQPNSQPGASRSMHEKGPATEMDSAMIGDGSSRGSEISDIEACVKNGLDSKAINPTVVVNDLQNNMDIMSLACMQKDDDKRLHYCCELCKAVFENKISLSNHMRSKSHMLEREKRNAAIPSPDLQRRRSERPVRKCTLENTNPVEEESPVAKKKEVRASPRRSKSCPLQDAAQPKSDVGTPPDISEDLKSKIGRAGAKKAYYKKYHQGPKLRATVKKIHIKCYICAREFTTKQHFIVHAKDHLKKLGYSHNDLFYCTICYAFYPCESDLRDHLIDKHANDNLDTVGQADQQGYDTTGNYTSFRNQGGDPDSGNKKQESGSDSDVAESTTDQLLPWDLDSQGIYSQGIQGVESSRTSQHSGPSMCHICGDTLGSNSLLRSHLKVHDKTPLKSTILPDPAGNQGKISPVEAYNAASAASIIPTAKEPNKGKKFSCHICGRMFFRVVDVDSHLITHDPKRPKLKCPLCQGECMWKGNFRNHLLRHATPVGQSFNKVTFNPNSKILCPFCNHVSVFYDADEFRHHMLEHVNKIMAIECAKVGNLPTRKTRKRPVLQTEPGSDQFPGSQQYPGKRPHESSTITELGFQGEAKTQAHVPPMIQKNDDRKATSARGQSTTMMMTDNSIQKPVTTTKTCVPPALSAGMTSTPNPYSGPQDTASSIGSVDTSPGGSLRGNSGLFMSPDWAWTSPSHVSSCGTTRPSDRPGRSYSNISSQRSQSGSTSQSTFGLNADSKKNAKTRPELNDSGFIQTFSGESDNGETVTPQSNPHASRVPKSAHSNVHMRQQSGSAMDPEEGDQDGPMTKYDFLSLARVSELMTTTSPYTSNFITEGYSCSICRQYRLTQANVKQHLFTHFDNSGRFNFLKKDGKHECPICMKMINDRRSSTAHLFSHWGAVIIKCPVCDRPFNLVKTMKMHLRKVHPNFEFSFDCYRKM